ncbi:hypothetical protein P154DRAFT_454350 [Amniculicola lignicola CBS 123094]|uniref:Uncharacterized protein n=1 Tax=Amniculicola lignicola CBS 123094 TaxID=1392246 RepID=A0A6A5X3M6_9PLEO|nr:hypothetical protein P154DRAFT_454350 [Amniculicola lignicola CBS 123094]
MTSPSTSPLISTAPVLPRVAITYCTQCRWMLRAAYFGQELLSTFSTQIGEIALIPSTGGLFQVQLTYSPAPSTATSENTTQPIEVKQVLIWDRKTEGGFPETKVLKQLIRDHIDPKKDLGHSDRGGKKEAVKVVEEKGDVPEEKADVKRNPDGTVCEDCN